MIWDAMEFGWLVGGVCTCSRIDKCIRWRAAHVDGYQLLPSSHHPVDRPHPRSYGSVVFFLTLVKVAIYTNDGAKSTLTQTKNPVGVDKAMYFPDDIGLDSASSTSNMMAKGDNNGGGGDDDASMHSTVRFFKFLENAAYVCELLAEGNAMTAEQELEEKD